MHVCALKKLVITELLSIIIPLSVPKVCRFHVQVYKALLIVNVKTNKKNSTNKYIRNVTRHRNGQSVKSRLIRWEWQLDCVSLHKLLIMHKIIYIAI